MQITPASAPLKLPVDSASELLNGPSYMRVFENGLLSSGGPNATLFALQAHVTSQFIASTSMRGYIRVTVDNVGIAADGVIAQVILPSPVFNNVFMVLSSIKCEAPQYGDDVGFNDHNPAYLRVIGGGDSPADTFDIVSIGQSPVSTSFAYIYHSLM